MKKGYSLSQHPEPTSGRQNHSAALREQLISELKKFMDSDALTVWAQGILTLKNAGVVDDGVVRRRGARWRDAERW